MLARGQPGPARALIDRALLVHRDLPGLLATRGRVAQSAGDTAGALGWYRASLAKDSTAAGVWTALAELQENLGKEAAAESSYSAAERHDPTGRSAINLGAFQLARGHLGLADSALARARRRLGDDPTLLYNLACLQARRGERDSALALLRRAARQGFTGEAAMRADPDLASLRAAPGFRAVLREVAANEAR
jgi:Flp pilus assembly protein TadD